MIETKVRAASLGKLEEITDMVNRAYDGRRPMRLAAKSREILQGYMPILPRTADAALMESDRRSEAYLSHGAEGDFNNACTDVGDLSHLFPVVNFTFKKSLRDDFMERISGSRTRKRHISFRLRLLALTVYKLLRNGGEEAGKICRDFTLSLTEKAIQTISSDRQTKNKTSGGKTE